MIEVFQKLLLIEVLVFGFFRIHAQEPLPSGSLEVSGRVRIEGKTEKLTRKRFYLLRGGLNENKQLIEKLKTAEIISRDCFYSQRQASPQFICWLKENNCESPYCRQISASDISTVPEFDTAFKKGLRQFGNDRASIAQNWLTTNLPPILREGFYLQRESLLENLLKDIRPLQSSMTDSVSVKAIFIDIPLNLTGSGGNQKKAETFLISNLLPMEIGNKSYIWACEIDINAKKLEKLILKVPDEGKSIKDCEVIIKELPECKTESCKK